MRYLPNLISAIRLAAVPVLVWLAWSGADRAFAWLLVAAGITDILDGWLARKYGWVSKLGALLDSAADISIVLVVLYAMWALHNEVFVYHGTIVWAILAVWCLSNLIGLYRYRRLPSFHTTSARIGLILFGVFVLVLFFYGFVPWLLYACGLICFLAGVESLLLVFLIDHWKPNLRGGIRALIRARTRRPSNGSERNQALAMTSKPELGIRNNLPQFLLLVLVNAFVGAMVGMERSILPAIAEDEFLLAARTAILSFIVVFGISKALTNYFAGRWSDTYGRRVVLIAGWIVALPVPFILMWAPTWSWIIFGNVLLGISQGLTWSTTVIMKIDLAGPKNRGFAMGVNEFAGYFAVAGSALATGYIASRWGLRPEPFYIGVVFVALGLLLSITLVKETKGHAEHEATLGGAIANAELPSQREIFWRTSLKDKNLSSISQAGLVNNLNDGMAWGLFPLVYATAGMSLVQIGWLAAIYPAVWGLGQLYTGALSDRIGRKGLIVAGMWLQSAGIVVLILSDTFYTFAAGAVMLGAGTAMVYPTLLAAIGDVVHPGWRASAVGVYRLWRDLGYAVGAVLAGIVADLAGLDMSMWVIAGLTFVSGTLVLFRLQESHAA